MLLKKEEVVKMFQNITETENTKELIIFKTKYLRKLISKKIL